MNSAKINWESISVTAKVLRSVNHPLRQSIVELLAKEGKMTVTDIYEKLKLGQSITSQHLAILRESRIVGTEREGVRILYYLKCSRLDEIMSKGIGI